MTLTLGHDHSSPGIGGQGQTSKVCSKCGRWDLDRQSRTVDRVRSINCSNNKHLQNVGPIRYCEPFYIAIHQVSLLSYAACALMSTTTTTARDRGDHYGPIEWAQ